MTPHPTRRRAQVEAALVPAFFLYGEPLRAPDERTVHVETIATRSRPHHWTIRPHRHHDLHQVLIVWRGGVEAQLDGRPKSLRGPALVIVPPGTIHSFRFTAPTDGLVVTFAAGLVREILSASWNFGDTLEQPAAAQLRRIQIAATDIEGLGSMLLREMSRAAEGRDSAMRGLLGALLANVVRLMRGAATATPTPANRARELVARFRAAVERRYREHLEICAYASQIGTTETTLRRACLAVAGQSPIELVHARMLIEAERQLRYSGRSVTQIAYYLGFEDPAYFSRFFSKRMRVSPRQFRGSDALA